MSFGTPSGELVTLIIGVLGAVLTYLGVRVKAKSDKEAAEPATWQSLTAEMKLFFKEQLEERDRRISALENRSKLHAQYNNWLVSHNFPRPPFLTFDEWMMDLASRGD